MINILAKELDQNGIWTNRYVLFKEQVKCRTFSCDVQNSDWKFQIDRRKYDPEIGHFVECQGKILPITNRVRIIEDRWVEVECSNPL